MSEVNGDSLHRLVGRCIVSNEKGWSREGTVLVSAPCRREKECPWFFFDEPRFPHRVRDLLKAGFSVTPNTGQELNVEAHGQIVGRKD